MCVDRKGSFRRIYDCLFQRVLKMPRVSRCGRQSLSRKSPHLAPVDWSGASAWQSNPCLCCARLAFGSIHLDERESPARCRPSVHACKRSESDTAASGSSPAVLCARRVAVQRCPGGAAACVARCGRCVPSSQGPLPSQGWNLKQDQRLSPPVEYRQCSTRRPITRRLDGFLSLGR